MAPQDHGYRAFIVALHERMAKAGSKAALIGGLGPKTYAAASCCWRWSGIAMTGLFVRALATGEFAGALFLVGFAALFGWQIGGFVRRNRPRDLCVRSFAADSCCLRSGFEQRRAAQRRIGKPMSAIES